MGRNDATKTKTKRGGSASGDDEATQLENVRGLRATPQGVVDDDDESDKGSHVSDNVAGKGQELLSLLQHVDHSKLIALLQSGALGGETADDTARARALVKIVRRTLWPLLPQEDKDKFDEDCSYGTNGVPDYTSLHWTALFESVDPAVEAKPSLEDYPHHPFINGRSRVPPSEVTKRLKLPVNTKHATVDTELKGLQDKQVRPLLRLSMHGLEQSAVDLTTMADTELTAFAQSAQKLLRTQSQYILMLHADIVRRRKHVAMQVLGLSEKEATGEETSSATSLFNQKDFDRMRNTVDFRDQVHKLTQKLEPKRKQPFKKSKKKRFPNRRDDSGETTGTDRQPQEKDDSSGTPKKAAAKKTSRTPSAKSSGRGSK